VPPLTAADRPLVTLYDVALLDLDGVVYLGPYAVPAAPEALATARDSGMHLAFVTNNAARPPAVVAAHLTDLGIAADPAEVITSAQAGARYLAERLPEGAKVLVIGTTGLYEALTDRGLVPVATAEDDIAAVIQGYSPDLNWHQLAEGAVAIGRGLPWVATNVDPSVPSPRGPLPGNGATVMALRHSTGVDPVVAGKPQPTMHRETILRTGAERPIVVGDRLDTDIEGANSVGCPSLLVLSGVTTTGELVAAVEQHRPTYLGHDLSALLTPHPGVETGEGGWRCGDWSATGDDGGLVLTRQPVAAVAPDDLDPLRVVAVAAWSVHDRTGRTPAISGGDAAAEAALAKLGLA